MNIIIVSDAWNQTNGVVTTLTHTQKELHRLGHQATVIGPPDYINLPSPDPDVRLALPFGLHKRLDMAKPDALHIAVEGPLGWSARRWALSRKVPFTTSYHTQWPQYLDKRYKIPASLTYKLMRHFHKHSSAILVNSDGMRDELLANGFNRLATWGRGVDLELFNPDKRQPHAHAGPVLISVGRLSPEKNLEAFLNLEVPGTKLVVGDGPSRRMLEERYPSAVFMGKKTGVELATLFASTDVFVFPSRTDTFGLVNLEALASGIPIVSYPEPGPRMILADCAKPAGVITDDLQKGVTEVLNGLAAGKFTQADCRAQAEKMGWEHPTKQLLSQLRRIDWANR